MDILALLQQLNPILSKTTIRQMNQIITAMLAMTGRVTMVGISRWTEKGGSYRTVQRYFQTTICWGQVMWHFFNTHLKQEKDEYVLAGDECVVTKSGKLTYGLDRFFSSLFGKPVPSVALFALSLVNCRERRAYPVLVEQVIRTKAEKAAARQKADKSKAKKQSRHGMVNLSQVLLRELRQEDSIINVLDLKAIYRGHKYVAETLKLLPEKPDPILLDLIFDRISRLGRVHNSQPSFNSL
jgi:hypothetical protein